MRRNGSDGLVTVDFVTLDLDESNHSATAGVDYEETSGTVDFKDGETSAFIKIKIIQKEGDEIRDDSFAI